MGDCTIRILFTFDLGCGVPSRSRLFNRSRGTMSFGPDYDKVTQAMSKSEDLDASQVPKDTLYLKIYASVLNYLPLSVVQ